MLACVFGGRREDASDHRYSREKEIDYGEEGGERRGGGRAF